jgi:hypothetical protein
LSAGGLIGALLNRQRIATTALFARHNDEVAIFDKAVHRPLGIALLLIIAAAPAIDGMAPFGWINRGAIKLIGPDKRPFGRSLCLGRRALRHSLIPCANSDESPDKPEHNCPQKHIFFAKKQTHSTLPFSVSLPWSHSPA